MDKTICVWGDSVAQAAYVKRGWVDLLKTYLENKYEDDFVNVFNLGIGGNSSEDILKRFTTESESRKPTDIVFAFGVNDSGYWGTKNKAVVTESKLENYIEKIIRIAREYTDKIIFIGLVMGGRKTGNEEIESGDGRRFKQERTKRYNEVIKKIVEKNNLGFVDLWDRLEDDDFSDAIHPNEEGHRKMFEKIKGNIQMDVGG